MIIFKGCLAEISHVSEWQHFQKGYTFCKTLNQIFTCGLRVWEWNIDLQQCPRPPKLDSISGSHVPLKIWVLQVLIFQRFDPPAISCTLSALPGCWCSSAQHWWGVNRKQFIPQERRNSKQLLFTLTVSWEAKTSTQTGVEQVMEEWICIGALGLPSDSAIIKKQDACYSSKLFTQGLKCSRHSDLVGMVLKHFTNSRCELWARLISVLRQFALGKLSQQTLLHPCFVSILFLFCLFDEIKSYL